VREPGRILFFWDVNLSSGSGNHHDIPVMPSGARVFAKKKEPASRTHSNGYFRVRDYQVRFFGESHYRK